MSYLLELYWEVLHFLSDFIGQIQLVASSSRLRFRTSIYFEKSHWPGLLVKFCLPQLSTLFNMDKITFTHSQTLQPTVTLDPMYLPPTPRSPALSLITVDGMIPPWPRTLRPPLELFLVHFTSGEITLPPPSQKFKLYLTQRVRRKPAWTNSRRPSAAS